MKIFRVILLFGALLVVSAASQAQIQVTFDQNPITTNPGATVTFTGELTNTSLNTLFINSDSLNLVGATLISDDSDFLMNAPISLLPGEVTSSFAFFTISSDVATPLGSYSGAFSVIGGLNNSASDDLSGTPPPAFQVNLVAPSDGAPNVPEPGSIALFGGLIASGTTIFLKRQRL